MSIIHPSSGVRSSVVSEFPSTSFTLRTVIVPPQSSLASSARSDARVEKFVVITSDEAPVSTFGPDIAFRFSTSRSLPMPRAMMRVSAPLILFASAIAFKRSLPSVVPPVLPPPGPLFTVGLPSEAKIIRFGFARGSNVLHAFTKASSQLVAPPLVGVSTAALISDASPVNALSTVAVLSKSTTENWVGVPGRNASPNDFIAPFIWASSLVLMEPELSRTSAISSPQEFGREGFATISSGSATTSTSSTRTTSPFELNFALKRNWKFELCEAVDGRI